MKRALNKGLTLVELAIATAVLAVAICGSLALFNYSYESIERARNFVTAASEAFTRLEQVRSTDYPDIFQTFNGVIFNFPGLTNGISTVNIVYQDANQEYLEATVTVNWFGKGGGAYNLTLKTLIANRY